MFSVRVSTAYNACYPNPITFLAGETVTVGKQDEEYPGWIWTTLSDGNSGWAPLEFLSITENSAIALSDYSAIELSTKLNEKLLVLQELKGWYWVRNEQNLEGWIPIHTVQIIE